MMYYVYMLKCADESLYTGWTVDPQKRLKAHNDGTASKYTRARLPVEMIYLRELPTKSEAMSLEWHIKALPRSKKDQLLQGRDPYTLFKKD